MGSREWLDAASAYLRCNGCGLLFGRFMIKDNIGLEAAGHAGSRESRDITVLQCMFSPPCFVARFRFDVLTIF